MTNAAIQISALKQALEQVKRQLADLTLNSRTANRAPQTEQETGIVTDLTHHTVGRMGGLEATRTHSRCVITQLMAIAERQH